MKARIPWLLVQSIKPLQRPILFLVILEPKRRVIWVEWLQKFLFDLLKDLHIFHLLLSKICANNWADEEASETRRPIRV